MVFSAQNLIGNWANNGTIAIGDNLKFLPQLQTLDLSGNLIDNTGDNGTIAIGKNLPYLTDLQTLDLSQNLIGTVGAQSLFAALPQLICHDLNLKTLNLHNLNSLDNSFTNIPWSQAASALEGQYSGQIQQQCEANRCFGTPIGTIDQNTIRCNGVNKSITPSPPNEDCSDQSSAASSLSPPFIMSLFLMSQRKTPALALLTFGFLPSTFLQFIHREEVRNVSSERFS